MVLMISLIILGIIFLVSTEIIIKDYREYKEYKDFCEEREDFCFCEKLVCEFKTQWSSEGGLSKDSKDLCELAKKLKDKRIRFQIGCEQ